MQHGCSKNGRQGAVRESARQHSRGDRGAEKEGRHARDSRSLSSATTPASEIYVRNKERACEQCGFYSEKYALPEETTQEELLGLIAQLNESPQISGILCQMPVPKHISEQAVIDAIDPKKDVDAFHPVNVGKIMVGNFDFVPCTPAGVMELLDEYKIDPKGKECVVVGRSNIGRQADEHASAAPPRHRDHLPQPHAEPR